MTQEQSSLASALRSALYSLGVVSLASISGPGVLAEMMDEKSGSAAERMDLTYYGYARSGIGSSAKGGKQACFQAAGTPFKHRLGNECETYTEQGLQATLATDNGTVFKMNTRLSYKVDQQKDSENPSKDNNDFALREVHITAENVFPALPGTKLWAGKRYYRRHDIHQLDWFYWNVSGPGAGIEDIDAGFGKFHLAWIRNEADVIFNSYYDFLNKKIIYEDKPIATNIIDLRLSDLKLTDSLTLELGLDYGKGSPGDKVPKKNLYDKDGYMGTAQLIYAFPMGGFNNFVVQYATDAMTGPGLGEDGRSSQTSEWFTGSKMTRFINFGQIPIMNRLDVTYVVGWTNMDYSDEVKKAAMAPDKLEWLTVGIRPQWKWSELTSTVLDLGWDKVKNGAEFALPLLGATPNYRKAYDDSQLYKVTLAQQFHPRFGAMVRPVIRVFITYANWDEVKCPAGVAANSCNPSTAGIGGDRKLIADNFGKATDGMTFGVQMEAWW